jgi:hypothetical protein
LIFTVKNCIKNAINQQNAWKCGKMYPMIDALKKKFSKSNLGKKAMAAAVAVPMALASFGPAANPAHAGETKAATAGERGLNAVQGIREMADFSRDPNIQGVGIFINVQGNAPEGYGDQIGKMLQRGFAKRGVPTDYRVNLSSGTATDIIFYVQGYDFTVGFPDLKREIPRIFAHHSDLWMEPQQVSLNQTPK